MLRTLQFVFIGLCFTAAAFAHHSTAAEYGNESVTLKGTVTKVDWRNPHIWIYIDVADAAGNVTNWGVGVQTSPARMFRLGWTKDAVKPGDVVTVKGVLPRNRELKRVLNESFILPDGRNLGR
jgi:DNA/RNA endonuclease YhcR with UshA esterase domain